MDMNPGDDGLPVKAVILLWKTMVGRYGHKWASSMGSMSESGDNADLSFNARVWRKELSGLTAFDLKRGFDCLGVSFPVWPPSVYEFRQLCLGVSSLPSVDEVVRILMVGTGDDSTIASRNVHPVVLAVRGLVDLFAMRSMSTAMVTKWVKTAYDSVVAGGVPGWPDNAFDMQLSIGCDRPVIAVDKSVGLSQIRAMRKVVGL